MLQCSMLGLRHAIAVTRRVTNVAHLLLLYVRKLDRVSDIC